MFKRTLPALLVLLALVAAAHGFGLGLGNEFGRLGTSEGASTFVASCTQSSTFLARTSGFTVTQKNQYNAAICFLATSGTLAKLDAIYRLAAPNQAASQLNLVSTNYSLTVNGTMTFGANAGWMGDGATGYLATGFVPSTAGGHYALGSSSLGIGITNPRQTNQAWIQIGSLNTTFTAFDQISIGNSGNNVKFSGGTVDTLTPATANGGWIGTYNGTTITEYVNGISNGTATSANTAVPDGQILIGAVNVPGVPTAANFSGDTLSWAIIGSGLTQADVTAITNAMAVFTTTNVPVPAIAAGFTNNIFGYNFATQGLAGIDVNTTLQPGFSFYTAYWLGTRSSSFFNAISPPSSSFSFTPGTGVTGGLGSSGATTAVISTRGNTSSAFVATISGQTMSVSSVLYGPLAGGQALVGSAALSGQTITSCQSPQTPPFTCQISSSATIGSSTNLMGNSVAAGAAPLFTAGGYYEAAMIYTTPGSPSGFPSFWMMDLNGFYAQNLNSGYGAADHWAEIDIVEAANASDANVIDWTNVNGGPATNNTVHQAYPAITNPAALHYYGMLWIPSTQNAGTGLIKFYLDRTYTGLSVSYTAAGTSTPACSPTNVAGCNFISESGNYVLLLQSGNAGYPATFQSVNVWH